jgi:hypothetical protein
MTFEQLQTIALHAVKGTVPANYTAGSVDMNAAFVDGLKELAGSFNQFMHNKHLIYDVVVKAADEVMPKKVVDALGAFAEIQSVGQGQKAVFKRKAGRNRAKKFLTQVGLSGVYETFRLDVETFEVPAHAVGGGATVDFERILDGVESLAEVMDVITEGLTDAVFMEVHKALRAAYSASARPDANKYTSSTFEAEEMVKLMNVVRAYGNGVVIFATPEFVGAMGADAVVPATTHAGVYAPQDIEAIHNTGFITIFRGAPIVQIPQSFVDERNEKTWIDPQLAYILPTGGEKVVKVVLEGPTVMWDAENRDQSMEVFAYKKMGCAIVAHHNWAIYQNTGIAQTFEGPVIK